MITGLFLIHTIQNYIWKTSFIVTFLRLPVLCRWSDIWRAYGCFWQGTSSQWFKTTLKLTLNFHGASVMVTFQMKPSVCDFEKFTLLIPQNSWCGQPDFLERLMNIRQSTKGFEHFSTDLFRLFLTFCQLNICLEFVHAIGNLIHTC